MSDAAKPELPKRFYSEARASPAEGGFAVLLDGRAIRTPARRPLVVPGEALAAGIAAEWQAQGERIDPATMPLTRLANTVVDGIADDPAPVRADLARFAETDLLFYRADGPDRLTERQRQAWDPVIAWAEHRFGGRFNLAEGVMHVPQPVETLAGVRVRVERESDPFRVAALHQMTTLTGSVLLALALADGHMGLAEAWNAAHLDEDWNIEQWGADEDADARRAARFEDMRAAALVVGRGGDRADQIPAYQS